MLRVGPGDGAVEPSFNDVTSANAVLYCSAVPVPINVDRDAFDIDLDLGGIASILTPKTAFAVHLFGSCVNVEQLRGFATRKRLAQSLETLLACLRSPENLHTFFRGVSTLGNSPATGFRNAD